MLHGDQQMACVTSMSLLKQSSALAMAISSKALLKQSSALAMAIGMPELLLRLQDIARHVMVDAVRQKVL